MSTHRTFQPDYAIHPGESLAETLEALGMSQADLAQRMGRPLQVISEIIQGKKAITAETALQLERATGVPATFWDKAQRNYEAAHARIEEERSLTAQLPWLKQFPLTALVKLGWIARCETQTEQLRALLSFFGVAGVSEWEALWEKPRVAFRQSPAFRANPMAVAAWLRQGERLAQSVSTGPYDAERFHAALREIRRLTTREPAEFEPRMKELCGEAGVAIVFVPEVPGTRAYGATRWLTPRKALLQLSLRGRADDFLWFTFFHESGHIMKHGKRDVFIEGGNGPSDALQRRKEVEADRFAADFLIPPTDWVTFVAEGRFTREAVVRFANRLGIAPSSVVGRLQHERVIPFNRHNGLKRRLQLQHQPD